jgi:hypothetical protein
MALIWCDGFDHYGLDETFMLDGVYASSNAVLQSTESRNGTHSIQFSQGRSLRFVLPGGRSTVGVAYAVYFPSLPSGVLPINFSFRDLDNDEHFRIVTTTTGAISVVHSSGQLAISNPVITAAGWHYIEAKGVFDDAAGAVEVRVNGVTVIDIAGVDTVDTVNPLCAQVAFVDGNFSPEWWMDDLVIWDDQGDNNNDFLGDRAVRMLLPDQDTVQSDWVRNAGDTDFDAIDDLVPDDDTTYIEAESGDISEFEFEGLPADVTIVSALVVLSRLRKTDAGACNVQQSLLSSDVGSPPAPAVAAGADRPITEEYTYWFDVIETDPATGAAWAPASVNAARLRLARTA